MELIKRGLLNVLVSNTSCEKFIGLKESDIRINDNVPRVFVAAMPKSAGTFLSRNISKILNTDYLHVGDVQGRCEFDIYVPNFIDDFLTKGGVVHQHINATKGNIDYLKKFKIKPVVVIRSLEEVLYSMHKHILKYRNIWPNFIYPNAFFSWNSSRQLDFIIDFVMPNIVEFQVSWENAIEESKVEILKIDFRNVVSDPDSVIREILKWSGIKIPNNIKIEKSENMRIEPNSFPFLQMNESQEERFFNLLSYYYLDRYD